MEDRKTTVRANTQNQTNLVMAVSFREQLSLKGKILVLKTINF